MRCRRRLGRSPVTVWVCRRLAAGSAGVYSVETEVDALDEVAALPARVCRADDSVGSGSVVGRPVQPAATGREHAHPHVQWRRPRARDLPCPGGRPASRDPSSALGQLTATPAQGARHRSEDAREGSSRESRDERPHDSGRGDHLGTTRGARWWTSSTASVRCAAYDVQERNAMFWGSGVAGSNPAVPTRTCRSEGV